jgi:hypothetical protein
MYKPAIGLVGVVAIAALLTSLTFSCQRKEEQSESATDKAPARTRKFRGNNARHRTASCMAN